MTSFDKPFQCHRLLRTSLDGIVDIFIATLKNRSPDCFYFLVRHVKKLYFVDANFKASWETYTYYLVANHVIYLEQKHPI